jgi:hypothetical protein
MATTGRAAGPASSVDHLVDENGSRIDVADDSKITPALEFEETVGAAGPTNWWRRGLIALGIVAAILLLLQIFGGTPGTDVQPGTPVAEPEIVAPTAG